MTPDSFSGLKILRCRELWYSLQMWLGSGVAVASSNLTPSLGTSTCHRYSPKKTKNKNKQTNKKKDLLSGDTQGNGQATNADHRKLLGNNLRSSLVAQATAVVVLVCSLAWQPSHALGTTTTTKTKTCDLMEGVKSPQFYLRDETSHVMYDEP